MEIIAREKRPAHVTSDATIAADLARSVAARGVKAGVTFGDLLAALFELGVTRNTPLGSIEIGLVDARILPSRRIYVEYDDDGQADIQEVK